MKLFKKKKDKKEELPPQQQAVDGHAGMPAPPAVLAVQQQLKHSRRNLQQPQQQQQQQEVRYTQREVPQQRQHQDPRGGYSHQQQEQQQQQQQQARHSQRQVGASHTRHKQAAAAASYPPQQAKQDAYPPQQAKQDAYPPQQAKQDAYPPQQAKQDYSRPQPHTQEPAPRQSFEATQEPPAKEKSAPKPVNVMDPVVQMERAAVTRELVKQYVADIWNRGDLDLIPKVCARGLRFNGSAGMDRVGHDGFQRMVETIRGSLEDYHCEIHSMVVEGNKAFCRMRFTGRHVGQLLGYEGTGKHVSWMGASEFTVVDGLIVKVWELGDMSSLEHQLRQASDGSGGRAGAADGGDC